MFLYKYEKRGLGVLIVLLFFLIIIPREFAPKAEDYFLLPSPLLPDTTMAFFSQTPLRIELNSADSATLVKVKGIGPYYASKIIRYRQRLGGYYSVHQLKELKLSYFQLDSCGAVFEVNRNLIQKKDFNRMSFKEVLRHPYLEYEDVKLIFNARNRYKTVSIDTLEKRKILSSFKLRKIKPYFH